MKRILLALAGLALLAGLTTSAMAAGVTTLTFGITVSVSANDIDLSGVTSDVPWGVVPPGLPALANLASGNPRSTVAQNGFGTIYLSVSASVQAESAGNTNWALVTTGVPGTAMTAINTCRLSGVFTAPLTTADAPSNPAFAWNLTVADFAANTGTGSTNVLSGTLLPAYSGATNGAINLQRSTITPYPEYSYFLGHHITPANNTRNLRYLLDAPIVGTVAPFGDLSQHRFLITIVGNDQI